MESEVMRLRILSMPEFLAAARFIRVQEVDTAGRSAAPVATPASAEAQAITAALAADTPPTRWGIQARATAADTLAADVLTADTPAADILMADTQAAALSEHHHRRVGAAPQHHRLAADTRRAVAHRPEVAAAPARIEPI